MIPKFKHKVIISACKGNPLLQNHLAKEPPSVPPALPQVSLEDEALCGRVLRLRYGEGGGMTDPKSGLPTKGAGGADGNKDQVG